MVLAHDFSTVPEMVLLTIDEKIVKKMDHVPRSSVVDVVADAKMWEKYQTYYFSPDSKAEPVIVRHVVKPHLPNNEMEKPSNEIVKLIETNLLTFFVHLHLCYRTHSWSTPRVVVAG
jgi:hypothetical protein